MFLLSLFYEQEATATVWYCTAPALFNWLHWPVSKHTQASAPYQEQSNWCQPPSLWKDTYLALVPHLFFTNAAQLDSSVTAPPVVFRLNAPLFPSQDVVQAVDPHYPDNGADLQVELLVISLNFPAKYVSVPSPYLFNNSIVAPIPPLSDTLN